MTFDDFRAEWSNSEEYVIAHTSGSTGAPKAVRLLKSDMIASARRTNSFFDIDRNSVLAIPLSADYIAGKMMWVRAWLADCRLKELEVSNRFAYDGDATLLAIVPSQAPWLLQHPEWAERTRNVIVGGSALREQNGESLLAAGYKSIYSTYGMTETMSHVALRKIEPGCARGYVAMPGISFDIDDRGCLVINQHGMSMPKIITNDMAELQSRTEFIWRGRYDNTINSGGIKIHPEMLEAEIAKLIDMDFYVVGIADEKWGEVPALVFEGSETQAEKIAEILRGALNHKEMPKKIVAKKRLLRTSSGKMIRKKPEEF